MSDTALAESADAAVAVSAPTQAAREPLAGGHLVPIGDLLSETIAEFTENIGPYAMVGVAQMLVAMPVAFALIIVIYAVIFGVTMAMMLGMVGSIAVLGEELGGIVALLVQLVGMVGMVGLMALVIGSVSVIMAPFHAGMARAIAAHQRGDGPPMSLGSPFATLTKDIGRVVPTALAYSTLSTIGLLFCYLPALAVVLFLGFANSLTALHGAPTKDALSTAFKHARENIGWYVPFTAAFIGLSMVAAYIPVLGSAFLVAFHVRAHRHLFGDGEAPAGA